MKIETTLKDLLNKEIKDSSNEELYIALLKLSKDMINEKRATFKTKNDGKKLYYISAEFLIGRLLADNMINLGIYDELKELLKQNGKDLNIIEELENEPSLGNGGLGRLAACFLDSIAALNLNGDGIGLNYHLGLFKQEFRNNKQYENKNPWITDISWLNKTDVGFDVEFKDIKVQSRLYDIDIVGYNGCVNKLHLFDIDSIDESIVKDGISFDQKDIRKNLTLFLYPDDSTKEGHLLRIYQQYFMVSNAAQLIIKEEKQKGHSLLHFDKYVAIQINDTHPSMIIPELIRLFSLEGIEMKKSIELVTNACAYTNHTILAEALEKWPYDYLAEVVPALMPVIEGLDAYSYAKFGDEKLNIIDSDKKVHMAKMDMHFSHSINGVAALHTEILKNSELNDFYKIYKEKFNNKTNGITFRRWLMHANPMLTELIDRTIGDNYKNNATELEKLMNFIDNKDFLSSLQDIKNSNKTAFAKYIKEHEGIDLDVNSVFCIQTKRLHEYKRQQMNALYIIYKYLEIKKGNLPKRPITVIIGGKAAPAYTIAKHIIELIICLQKLIESDETVSKHLRVVMLQNYNVSYAEKLIPACDISEQISLASKEASGTGNMKFMLNGAITLGTEDGANVEIHELVGDDNIFIFGKDSDTIIKHYENGSYIAREFYNKPLIKPLVDFITDEKLISFGDKSDLEMLKNEIINKDWFMTLIDLEDYIKVKDTAINAYEDREKWQKMMLVNIAKAGFFSSDRTIEQYNNDIWKL